jgi:hypothetical protein
MTDTIQQKTGTLNDIIKIINRANETFVYEIFIPSLNKNLMFREINTSQQKRLLKAIIDSPAYNTEFIFTLREIIKENCVDNSVDVGEFTIFDKMIVAMTMRAMSISNDLDLVFEVPNTNPPEKITRRINLKDLINTAISEIQIGSAVLKDDKEMFQIFCGLPTINDEFKLESELRRNVTSIEIKNEKELRETVGEVFTNEIVKYIKQINIKNENGEIIELNLKDLKFVDRLTIMSKIPAKINNMIINYINQVNKEFEKVILFKEVINEKVTVEQRLKIDASFFTVS